MNIIENWNLLNERINGKDSKLTVSLLQIHMGAFDDLRKCGHMVEVDGKPVSELAPIISPQQRLELAGRIGRDLIQVKGDLFDTGFVIRMADAFPNCIFIALAALIENTSSEFNVMFSDKKMKVTCEYETAEGKDDPLGKILPKLEDCYSWISLSTEARQTEAPVPQSPRYIPEAMTNLVFTADMCAKIDTMRTAFGGTVQRGSIRKGDVLNVVDGYGKVLCHEGMVLAIYIGGKEVQQAEANQHIDEICLAVEIPAGKYNNILLVDGDKTLAECNQVGQKEDFVQDICTTDTPIASEADAKEQVEAIVQVRKRHDSMKKRLNLCIILLLVAFISTFAAIIVGKMNEDRYLLPLDSKAYNIEDGDINQYAQTTIYLLTPVIKHSVIRTQEYSTSSEELEKNYYCYFLDENEDMGIVYLDESRFEELTRQFTLSEEDVYTSLTGVIIGGYVKRMPETMTWDQENDGGEYDVSNAEQDALYSEYFRGKYYIEEDENAPRIYSPDNPFNIWKVISVAVMVVLVIVGIAFKVQCYNCKTELANLTKATE